MVFGLLNINKPIGPTSHDIVAGVRRGSGEKRVGHAGTLDPMASGVLIVAMGPATRLVEYLTASRKVYIAQVTLGIITDSYDAEGAEVSRQAVPGDLTPQRLEAVLQCFRGAIMQVPPVYSAIKVGGKSAHTRVRAGQEVRLEARSVMIHRLDLLSFESPRLTLRIECSPGTYIRSLAHDVGRQLGCGAMLSALTRTASGSFSLEESVAWTTLQGGFTSGEWRKFLFPADRALEGTARVQLDQTSLERIRHGASFTTEQVTSGVGRAFSPDGQFVAVVQGDPATQLWRPIKVFAEVLGAS